MDLSQLSCVELMQLNQLTLDELERRDVLRTRNNPVCEYTEWLVAEKMQMELGKVRISRSFLPKLTR
ncbi:hypothetical protein [Escherichia coli]|uniref:hypothetical protein n=1 Tax=Escherichia coli TaxID=562 RepID=UPI0030056D6D